MSSQEGTASTAAMPTPEEMAKKIAFAQFLAGFVPFAEANGGANYAEMAAVFGSFGVPLTAEQIQALGKGPAPPGGLPPVPPIAHKLPTDDELSPPPGPGQAFCVAPDQGAAPRLGKTGVNSRLFPVLYEALRLGAEKLGDAPALRVEPAGLPVEKAGTEWITYSWKQYHDEVVRFAKALLKVGFEPFQAVSICGFNHPCWFFAHVAAAAIGGMSAGTYTTNSPEACAFVASDSNARVVAVDNIATLRKYIAVRTSLPNVVHAVVWGVDAIPEDIKAEVGDWALTYQDFVKLGDGVSEETFQARAKAVEPRHCSSLIYTSGTTGNPKGVMMSHDSIAFAGAAGSEWLCYSAPEQHVVSYLPMSHIAAQVVDCAIPIMNSAEGKLFTVHFARPDVLKGTIKATLVAARPTMFFGVPRVWEKFVEGVKAAAAASAPSEPATVRQLKGFAMQLGVKGSLARQVGGDGVLPPGYAIAKQIVFAKARAALGLDRCELAMTGAAPIPRQTLDFLSAIGIDLLEVYGMSETAGMGTMSRARQFKFGSCGPIMPPGELKIDHLPGRDKEGEGEICFRGRHVMMGYLRNEQKTREAIDPEGWMHSGDIGRIDENGQVYITGRIKELIITAGGENIAPVPIESRLKALMPALSNVVMIGDRRKYNTMLVTLKSQPNLDTGAFHDDLVAEALAVNPEVKTVTAARTDAAWKAYIEKGLAAYNAEAVSNAQKIQKFTILATDLSLPGGELTPTMKLKRDVMVAKYAAEIAAMYDGEDS